ncbi:MAG: MFS transporter [Armatimonadetes bacterium]|nr:MFS transporter [Armatimonadota bacterium]
MDSTPVSAAREATPRLYLRLSFMMFLQFAVWGAWSVVIAGHMEKNLHFAGIQIALIFGTTAWGSIVAPMIAGNIADRLVPVQIFTAGSHLAGALLLLVAWKMTTFAGLWVVMFLYAMAYMPTIALTNTIAFYHMGDSRKFGNIRVWGTLGWIVVQTKLGLYLGYWRAQSEALADLRQADCLIFAAVASLLLGVYCFTLPNTPPSREARNPYAFLEAFRLTTNRNFLVLLVISFIVAIELPFYYNLTFLFLTEQAGGVGLDPGRAQLAMTIGQWGEVLLMVLLWPMLRWGGVRWTIFLGILAWPLRYTIFAIGEPAWLVVASQALHGICYSFFFVGGMIAVERLAPKDIRASAQSLILFATNGCGMAVGHLVSGFVHDHYKLAENHHDWARIFIVPIVVTVTAGLLFLLTFNERQYRADAARLHEEAADPVL